MPETYNVYIDSNDASILTTGNVANEYYINWASIMPDGSYNVSFSFMCQSDDDILNTELGTVFCNLGGTNQFKANGSATTAIGFLSIVNIALASSYFYADRTTNPKVYLKQRPNENALVVRICDGFNTNNELGTVQYNMILHFEKL